MGQLEIALRLLLAAVVGGIIGYERERNNRTAGFRTHILVCVGAAVTSMIQLQIVSDIQHLAGAGTGKSVFSADYGRLAAQVISGVGFLGAGTILHEKGSVKGLTTAASLWTVACIGIAAGFGYYSITILSTLCVYVVLVILKKFEDKFIERSQTLKLEISFSKGNISLMRVEKYFADRVIKIKNIEFISEGEENYSLCYFTILVPRDSNEHIIINEIRELEYVSGVRKMS
ncbi:MgtC/SapB family protein [Clostridium sp. 19966]|uniref:MgtC/SapB family protein n=1 Tax=Clostridium sp. 19966 TaxID=2768166 RepID=UPI0028DEAB9F|nr:MgtC/SapB family protein [Clostridium sp. 19966]MDT8717076.1 MgtC/SapB family protein [Clostridium sp. 19966]